MPECDRITGYAPIKQFFKGHHFNRRTIRILQGTTSAGFRLRFQKLGAEGFMVQHMKVAKQKIPFLKKSNREAEPSKADGRPLKPNSKRSTMTLCKMGAKTAKKVRENMHYHRILQKSCWCRFPSVFLINTQLFGMQRLVWLYLLY